MMDGRVTMLSMSQWWQFDESVLYGGLTLHYAEATLKLQLQSGQ